MESIPDASGIVEGNEGKSDDDEEVKGGTGYKQCILFLIHFSPSKYVKCNYCFVMEEKHLSDTERFMIKFNELKEDNANLVEVNRALRNDLEASKTPINTLSQTVIGANRAIEELNQRIEHLEQARDEMKVQEIDLIPGLQNNYVRDAETWAAPKARKTGDRVHLSGRVKGGSQRTVIYTLPEGWRPAERGIFATAQNENKICRIDILPEGNVKLISNWKTFVSLDGITFVAA